ncbi:carbonic anhydrase family protein, partial [Kribbella sp. NPDC051587]|uniref:carbonic anhydrase family protein n=1 Tax=Kribbella sp. NPDC051587 TaxID=3364119 RepID=UPI0037B14E7A
MATVPAECSENVQLRGANLAAALPTDLSTFRYDGSLTTVPYTEPVSWLVLNHIREIKSTSLAHFQSRFPDGDSRPLQPLNGRTVTYRPQHSFTTEAGAPPRGGGGGGRPREDTRTQRLGAAGWRATAAESRG